MKADLIFTHILSKSDVDCFLQILGIIGEREEGTRSSGIGRKEESNQERKREIKERKKTKRD